VAIELRSIISHVPVPHFPGSFGDRVSQGEERDCDCPAGRQGTQFLG
jgi:hypothetical protein